MNREFAALLLAAISTMRVAAYTTLARSDQITSMPSASSSFRSNQFSGLLNITSSKYIHYFYIESENDPETDSIVFWTNGGPGCSGLLGLFAGS
jgi:carboxypeptidase C (cathepsin A)